MRTPLLELVAKLLFLPMLVLSAALLVKSHSLPGGGFSAGAIAGVAVLLQRIVFGHRVAHDLVAATFRDLALSAGVVLTIAVAVVPALTGGTFLAHHPVPGAEVMRFGALQLHTALLFDAGVALVVFSFVLTAVALVAPEEAEHEEGQ